MMKRIMKMLLVAAMASVLTVSTCAASYTVTDPKWVTIDGTITQEEWGKPIYKGVTLQQAQEGNVDDMLTCRWFDPANNADASFDLYITHNDKTLFVGCVIHNVDAEISTDAASWQQMNFAFTVSDYREGTDVSRIVYKEKNWEAYTGYRILINAQGQPIAQPLTQGMDAKSLYAGEDFRAVYDAEDRTMTYEVALPFAFTNINLNKSRDIVLSAVIALNYHGNTVSGTKDGANRWLVGTGTANCGGAETWAHQGQCIRIQLALPPIVSTANYHKDLDVEIPAEPQYNAITANEPISTPLMIMFGSVAVVILCAVAVTITLVRERNKKAALAVIPEDAVGKDGDA